MISSGTDVDCSLWKTRLLGSWECAYMYAEFGSGLKSAASSTTATGPRNKFGLGDIAVEGLEEQELIRNILILTTPASSKYLRDAAMRLSHQRPQP